MATGQFNIAELTLQKRLTALNRVVIQLMSVTSIDQLAHDAIAFGISLLGFDRLGLYFCSANDPKVITGTYGTDANGQLCGEHGTTIQMSEADWLFQAKFLRENHSWVVLHSTLYQPEPGMNQNQTVGQGWNAAAALWNGDQIVGYLFADNLLHHRPYSDDEGELLAAYGFALGHLMIRLRTEETLRQQQAHYRALLEAMPDLLFTLNRAGDVVDFHLPPGEHLLAPLDQLVGRNLCDLVPPPLATQVLQSIELAYRTGECATFEYTLPVAGETRYYEARLVVAEGNVVLALVRNITNRKLLEEQLVAARKMESLGRMAGGVAHDFNNLLTVIQGFASIAARYVQPEQTQVQRALTQIVTASAKGARVTSQLLSFARKQVIEPEVIDLKILLTEIAPLLQQALEKTITFVLTPAARPMPIRIARTQLEQLLLNLATNANDAMAAGGQFQIRCDEMTLTAENARRFLQAQVGHYVVLEVSDTGSGIDPAIIGNIFDPFFTTKQGTGHSGLGLAICHGIVQQNGGHISVQSVPHHGTTFQIFLPYAEVPLNTLPERAVASGGYGDETILYVEDDLHVRTITAEGLQEFGYKIVAFAAGADAVHYAQTNPAAFALLITDMMMPQMNGKDVAKAILACRPQLPVLIVSGYVDERPDDLVDFTLIDFLSKPYSMDALAERARSLLDKPRAYKNRLNGNTS